MNKKELLERLETLKDDIDELIDNADDFSGDQQRRRVTNSIFFIPFADVKALLRGGFIDLFRVGDQIVNKHEKFGLIAWDVIGKNHDMPASGEVTPTLTLQMHDVLPGVYVYSSESDSFPYGHAHYPSSDIRNTLNVEILKGFSEEDRAAMLEVEKTTFSVVSEGNKPETTVDKLFLLSASEAGFAGETVRPEGNVYEYYEAMPARRCKAELDDPEQARYWWLRSPHPGYASYARSVNTSGAQYSSVAYLGLGAAAACVIG